MLRRHGSKSKPDLSRRKSTSSVHGVHLEHIDPAVAQRDAQAAACQAFSRAQARDRIEMPLFPPTPESSPRRRRYPNDGSSSLDGDTPGGPAIPTLQELRRRQSVRFIGPCSTNGMKSRSVETSSTQGLRNEETTAAHIQDDYDIAPKRHLGEDYDGPQQPKVASVPHQEPAPVPLPGMASGHLVALMAGEEYYTPEDDIASAPSSFRRLRRSRSMFTADGGSAGGYQAPYISSLNGRAARGPRSGPSISSHKATLSAQSGHTSRAIPQLRTPKSMSFLRTRSQRSGSVTTQGTGDGGVQTPQQADKYRHGFRQGSSESPRLVSKPSFFSSRSKRTEPVLRKSLRSNTSTNDPETRPSLPATAHISTDKEDRLKVKARKVSKSLKAKLKRFFSLTKSLEEPPSFPPQHIAAQKTHVTEGFLSPISSNLDQDLKSEVGWGSVRRVPSGVPSVQMVPPNLVRSNKCSFESLKTGNERKVSDDKSLTSWAGSGPSTLTSQQQQEWREWERQRLSIINENGAHAPTSSFHRRTLAVHIFQNENPYLGNPGPPGPIVDSQRVYSALMKRVHRSSNEADTGGSQRADFSGALSGATNAAQSTNFLGQAPAETRNIENGSQIRYQQSSPPADLDTPTRVSKRGVPRPARQGIDAGQFRTGSPSPMNTFPRCQELVKRDERRHVEECGSERFAFSSTTHSSPGVSLPDPFTGDKTRPSLRSQHDRDDQRSADLSSQELESINTPTAHLFRTKSPFRQALRKSIETEQLLNCHQSSTPTPLKIPEAHYVGAIAQGTFSMQDADRAGDTQYSASVYSTDEYHSDRAKSPTIYRPAGCRDISSASSIDWKTWLSANIEKFESAPTPPLPSAIEYALPTMPKSFQPGHVRELAQTHDEDEDFQRFEATTHTATLPTSPLATVEPNVMKFSPLQRSIKRTSPPSTGKTLLENDSPHSTPPIPPKSSLRAVHPALARAGSNVGHSLSSYVASSPGLSAALEMQFGGKYCERGNSIIEEQVSPHNDRVISSGGRVPRLYREGKPTMAENVDNTGQKGTGNQNDSIMAFV